MHNLKTIFISLLVFISAIITGCSNNDKTAEDQPKKEETKQEAEKPTEKETAKNADFKIVKAEAQKLDHIHGIGYPGNDDGLYVASHHGIKIYSKDGWMETTSEKHDYMGFQSTKDGFVASGHPEEGSNLKDPLGLVKSSDKGQSLQKLAFYGESDFHFMAAGHNENTYYVINEHPNSKLDAGVFFTEDEGKTWKKVELKGFESNTLGMISVHPSKGNLMAMSTRDGIYYSDTNGMNIKKVSDSIMTTAVIFSEDNLIYSSVEGQKIKLSKLDLKSFKSQSIDIPELDYENPVTYIAVDPKNKDRMAFVTYKNDIFETTNGGADWKTISTRGHIQ